MLVTGSTGELSVSCRLLDVKPCFSPLNLDYQSKRQILFLTVPLLKGTIACGRSQKQPCITISLLPAAKNPCVDWNLLKEWMEAIHSLHSNHW